MYRTPKRIRLVSNNGMFDEIVTVTDRLSDGDLRVGRKSPNRVEFVSLGRVEGWRPGDVFDGYLKGARKDGRWTEIYDIVITML